MTDSMWLELDQEWNSIHCSQGKAGDVLSLMIDGNTYLFKVLEAKGKKVRIAKMDGDDEAV
jgi:hypothetical protein